MTNILTKNETLYSFFYFLFCIVLKVVLWEANYVTLFDLMITETTHDVGLRAGTHRKHTAQNGT